MKLKTLWTPASIVGFVLMASVWSAPVYAEGAADERQAIRVSAAQRDYILAEMRGFLIAVQDIVLGVAEGDMASVAEAAQSMAPGQSVGNAEGGKGLNTVLPLKFRQIGHGTHAAFGELAQAAEMGPEGILEDLGTLMSNCTDCHDTFKLVVNK